MIVPHFISLDESGCAETTVVNSRGEVKQEEHALTTIEQISWETHRDHVLCVHSSRLEISVTHNTETKHKRSLYTACRPGTQRDYACKSTFGKSFVQIIKYVTNNKQTE